MLNLQLLQLPLPLSAQTAESALTGENGFQRLGLQIDQSPGSLHRAWRTALHLSAPIAQERAKHPIGITTTGFDQIRSQQQLIPIHQHLATVRLQGFGHLTVPFPCIGLHIPAPDHRRRLQVRRQPRQHLHRVASHHQQSTPHVTPALLKLAQAFHQEPQPGRSHRRQRLRRVDQRWIQHIHARHPRADRHSRLQTEVVGQAQVAAMPKQNARRCHQRPSSCLARNQAVTLLPSSHSSPDARRASNSDGVIRITSRSSSSSPAGGCSKRVSSLAKKQ